MAPKKFDWKTFFALWIAGLVGVLSIMPMMLHLIESGIFGQKATPDIPFPAVIALALVQNGVLLAAMIAGGMALSPRVGLRMPLVSSWTQGEPFTNGKQLLTAGLVGGAFTGVALVTMDAVFFLKDLPASMTAFFDVPLWKRLLAGVVYGGITEELLMRLFLVSLFAWVLGKFFKAPDGRPAAGAFWAAIFLVALLFGLGHLPITSAITPLTPLVVVRALVLNGFAGVVFGYLYWRHGLEAAILAHMSAHLVMQGPGFALLKSML